LITRVVNFKKFESFSFKFKVLVNKCCITSKIKPTANSTAENTSTKKDNDNMFRLS